MKEVLSNPMDLTVVARMLAKELSPDLFHLQEQQYTWMAEEYRQSYGFSFPRDFAEEAYRMRLEDRADIPKEKFEKSLSLMEEEPFKLVVRREWTGLDDTGHGEWHFRHDKIQAQQGPCRVAGCTLPPRERLAKPWPSRA